MSLRQKFSTQVPVPVVKEDIQVTISYKQHTSQSIIAGSQNLTIKW